METFVNLFGPLDSIHESIEWIILGLVAINLVTRHLAHSRQESQYDDGDAAAVARYWPNVVSNLALLLASFYFMTVHHHGGFVMSMLVLGLVITDFFEFESRKVEARRELDLDRPKAAIAASGLVLLYALWQVFFQGPIGSLA